MTQLNIKYDISKTKKIGAIIIGLYLLIFCAYFLVTQYLSSNSSTLSYTSFIGVVLATLFIMSLTIFSRNSFLHIDNEWIKINMPNQSKLNVEWVNVSKINIGVSYIVLLVDGGKKQKKIDLSPLKYTDVGIVKAKIIEFSEFKNIPYTND